MTLISCTRINFLPSYPVQSPAWRQYDGLAPGMTTLLHGALCNGFARLSRSAVSFGGNFPPVHCWSGFGDARWAYCLYEQTGRKCQHWRRWRLQNQPEQAFTLCYSRNCSRKKWIIFLVSFLITISINPIKSNSLWDLLRLSPESLFIFYGTVLGNYYSMDYI